MLSRTADGLFWLARYMERAASVARLVQVGNRMSNMSLSLDNPGNEWRSTLIATGTEPGYLAKHGEVVPSLVLDYLVLDPENPSSIVSCIETARRNGRAVRTALTVDTWEALNETWQQTRALKADRLAADSLPGLMDWVVQRSLLFCGSYANTMLRNDGYLFTHLGTLLERADNTARILDVKYHVLLPDHEGVGGVLDYYQWQSILRAVSALRSYHWVYHDRLKPWLIAELLILRPEMPRSLVACLAHVVDLLEALAVRYGGQRGECHRLAGEIHARLRYGRVEDIFQFGLHEYVTQFIDDMLRLGQEISGFYLNVR
ncbi:alpha-E domain-containing protein [Nitrospirillum sp. BR 11164]|uniref:alpha-E domain-containing protein n=1 Tax=Nitrospirillum sp. BR 11164 TaxID=3104324 RepID=UPI002AFE0CB2|nr:alpha-E domain-containing protein [Nitrospirillum sp. BR 11164]MEA1647442.1 alpha-E domain-containing protein [Nitrospirillum sp. BR 11164]